jgi:NAD(P)-dependent dehydrogenase (short-subunit alcohol dehydrogenase family)
VTTNQIDEHPGLKAGTGRLDGKVALVTGADSGIGRATARLFAREGASVLCVDRDERGTPRVDVLIERDGGRAAFLRGDVAHASTSEEMVAAAIDHFGGLDIAFLNAGTGVRARLHEMPEEAWHHVVDINLNGMYYGVKAVMPHFLAAGHGNIVATASSFGVTATAHYPAYCATKAAIVNLTRNLAIDYGPTVRINCVCPGPTDTARVREFPPRPREITDEARASTAERVKGLHRMARPEEIAYAVLFLASDESSFVTGHALVVDGGQTVAV